MNDQISTRFTKHTLSDTESLNEALKTGFYQFHHSDDVRRTHLFHGRYENIYIDEDQIPAIRTLLDEAIKVASQIIDCDSLQAGLWFNHMPPGAITTAHTHDDYDELLSGVYYITAPENSGNLIIHDKGKTFEITPEAGMFVFFKPDALHEVSQNNSGEDRLSVGINFGRKKRDR